MSRSPVVSFGLCATKAAKQAKCGQAALRGRIELAVAALRTETLDAAARGAVADFLAAVDGDPRGAGDAFQAFIDGWIAAHVPEPERTMADATPEFDWQRRADLQ